MARYKTEDGTILDTEKAVQSWHGTTDFDGSNHISRATGSQWNHERLHKSRKGHYWLESWSQWQGSMPSGARISDESAAVWLIHNGYDLPADLAELENAIAE